MNDHSKAVVVSNAALPDVISDYAGYMDAQAKALDERLEAVSLSDQQIDDIQTERGVGTVRDALLGLLPIGKVVKALLDWNEGVSKDVRDAKRNVLLQEFLNTSDDHTRELARLKSLMTSSSGTVLFNKIIAILDNGPPEPEQVAHLVAALRHIADHDFGQLFQTHRFALGIIERHTPQALSILAAKPRWPILQMGSYSSDSGKITSDYHETFANSFSQAMGIKDPELMERVKHSTAELRTAGLIEAHLLGENKVQCALTRIGSTVTPYLADTYK